MQGLSDSAVRRDEAVLTDREAGSPHLDEESEATSHLVVGRTVRTRSTQTSVHPLPTHHARPINKQPLTTAWRCRLRASESSPGAKVRLRITDALPQSQRPRRGAAGTRPSGHSGLPSSPQWSATALRRTGGTPRRPWARAGSTWAAPCTRT